MKSIRELFTFSLVENPISFTIFFLFTSRTTVQVKTHAQMVLKKIDDGEDVFATLHDDNEGLRSLSTVKKAQQNSFYPMKLQEEVSAHDVMISPPKRRQHGTVEYKQVMHEPTQKIANSSFLHGSTMNETEELPPLPNSRRKDDNVFFTEEVFTTPTESASPKIPSLVLSSMKVDEDQTSEAILSYHLHTDVAMAAEVLLALSTPVNRVIMPKLSSIPENKVYRVDTLPTINDLSEPQNSNDIPLHRSLSHSSSRSSRCAEV